MKNYLALAFMMCFLSLHPGNGISSVGRKRIVNVTHCGREGVFQNADGTEIALANEEITVEADEATMFVPRDIKNIETNSRRMITIRACLKSWSTSGDGTFNAYPIADKKILIRKVTERIFIKIKIENNVPSFNVIQQDHSGKLFEC